MTELDIEAIRERSQRCDRLALTRSASTDTWALAAVASAADVPALLAEIERLRGELGHTQYVVADGVERIAGHLAEIERLRDDLNLRTGQLMAARSASDLNREEVDRLRTELAEEKQSHEQTVENFADWIEDHQARSFRITPPTHTTGWVWNCLRCTAEGSFSREPDAFGFAVAHENRTHAEAARAET